jgi:hypothetical protein
MGTLTALAALACGDTTDTSDATTGPAGSSSSTSSANGQGGNGGENGTTITSGPCLAQCPDGGAGGTSNVVTSTSTGSTDCGGLEKAFVAAFELATSCNACQGADHCIQGVAIHDACGCVVGGIDDKMLTADAESAYQAWVAAGCGPLPCGAPCPPPSAKYACQPGGGASCDGSCGVI